VRERESAERPKQIHRRLCMSGSATSPKAPAARCRRSWFHARPAERFTCALDRSLQRLSVSWPRR